MNLTKNALCTILAGIVSFGAPLMSVADDVVPSENRSCSSIDDASARLDCYDELSGRQASEQKPSAASSEPAPAAAPVAASAPAPAAASAPAAAPVVDDIGSEQLRGNGPEKISAQAMVTRCSESSDGRYFFHLNNGQVWKQVKSTQVYFSDCEFGITISKDFFGYKMQPDGEKSRIRISRVR